MNPFRKFKAYLRYREAVRKANEAYEKTGKRFYVVPASGKRKTLLIMDRENFRKLKQKRFITRNAYISDLENKCFYATPYRNGSGELPKWKIAVKKMLYYKWYEDNGKIQRKTKAGH